MPFEPRKKPLQERALRTVEALLEATAQLLVESGYEKTSTNRIAKRAGVSIGSLYQYFPNKEALMSSVVERLVDAEIDHIQAHLDSVLDEHATLKEVIPEIFRGLLDAQMIHPHLARVLYQYAPPKGQVQMIVLFTRRFQRIVLRTLEHLQEPLRPENLELASFVLVSAVQGIIRQTILDRQELLADDALATETAQLVLRYLQDDV